MLLAMCRDVTRPANGKQQDNQSGVKTQHHLELFKRKTYQQRNKERSDQLLLHTDSFVFVSIMSEEMCIWLLGCNDAALTKWRCVIAVCVVCPVVDFQAQVMALTSAVVIAEIRGSPPGFVTVFGALCYVSECVRKASPLLTERLQNFNQAEDA